MQRSRRWQSHGGGCGGGVGVGSDVGSEEGATRWCGGSGQAWESTGAREHWHARLACQRKEREKKGRAVCSGDSSVCVGVEERVERRGTWDVGRGDGASEDPQATVRARCKNKRTTKAARTKTPWKSEGRSPGRGVTEQDRTGQDRTGQKRTEQNSAGQDRTAQARPEECTPSRQAQQCRLGDRAAIPVIRGPGMGAPRMQFRTFACLVYGFCAIPATGGAGTGGRRLLSEPGAQHPAPSTQHPVVAARRRYMSTNASRPWFARRPL
ncbi:hypothetical protein PMIN01_12825 [Paraphaeosphaeria minitans]|uniref:Uncharacterized protein n=1 Tax=Paraphaeosphaeria minitans TaxID=565426 RepID=A0A9P6G629_9PLEO|nr:hypothetical protein PMIN01_12825 [Paraphaeosphaeria minitans]